MSERDEVIRQLQTLQHRDNYEQAVAVADRVITLLGAAKGPDLYMDPDRDHVWALSTPKGEERTEPEARHHELVKAVKTMLSAIDAGQIDSPELDGDGENIPPHRYHEQWAHHARRALSNMGEG